MTDANAVANGEPVEDGQYGFATKLVMTDIPRDASFYDSACSGALIAPQWIISAGHCFHSAVIDGSYENASGSIGPGEAIPYGSVTAILGRAHLEGETGHEISVIEAYQAGTTDIAIAKLATPVTDVRPLRLPSGGPEIGDILRITGWGALDAADADPAVPQLQTGQVQVSSVAATTLGVKGYLPQADTSACVYDSGAPYFAESSYGRPTLVGIESDGPSCPHDQEETLARVDSVVGWIIDTMAS
ncbi:MAG: trypsin-like serine protease [Dactylosporangium sp.]|nr:trypsin-like serine protease [Dactylosporangium sp.]